MKKISLILLLYISSNSYADSEKSIVNSDLHDVKVYLSGAQISRSIKTTLEGGVTQLSIENLSPQIDRNSISVSVKGDAMILSTSYSLDYLKEKKETTSLKRLKDSLDVLNDNMNEMNMLKSVYNEEIGMLNANKSVGGSNVGLTAENLHKAIDFYRERMIEVKGKLLEIDKKQVKLNEKIKRINEQIESENGKMNQPFGTILVNMSAKQSTPVEIELSYFASGASWNPVYDLRAKDISSPVSLMYKANVSQNTGENWDKVHVSLSTGNPTLNGTRPILQPWYLRYYVPMYQPQSMELNERALKKNQGVERMSTTAEAPAAVQSLDQVVVMQENQVVTEFDITIPYSVPTNGKAVMMDIQSFSLPANFSYYATPKMEKDAFLIADLTGWEKLNLLPGKASVYLENSYVGESYINPNSTSDTLQLSFGRDKRIVLKREMVKDMNTTKFFGGNVEKEFMYETSIRNNKKDNISLTIEDQVPLTTDETIKITNGELSGGNLNAETGLVKWKIELKSGETKKIRLGYKVKYPKDKVISGL